MATQNSIDTNKPIGVDDGGTGTTTLTVHGVLIGNTASAINATAAGTANQILTSSGAANDPVWTTATYPTTAAIGTILVASGANTITTLAPSTAGYVLTDGGAGVAPSWQATPGIVDLGNILFVGKHGDDANNGESPEKAKLTIQAAVTAAAAGDTIIVYPGTYTETITHAANNVTIIAEGKPNNCIITQADANVIDFATFSGIQYKYFGISCTAATTAIWTVQGSTGSCSFKECQLSMTSAADIAAVNQPGVGRVTGAGTLTVTLGKAYYYHTGNGGGTANKGAFAVANGGIVKLNLLEDLTITNSGTALVSSVGIDTASTGNFEIHDCIISVTDPNAVIVVGLAYLGGTGTSSEFFRNTIHVVATNNTGYGFFSADTASDSRFFFNHIHVEDTAGLSYSYLVGATATVTAIFDDVIAADGASVAATGIFYEVKSPSDGDLKCSGPEVAGTRYLTVANTDNTATASSSAVNISVGGATSTGDPYTNYLVTGAGTYSVGIDNTDSDKFKITSGATPSAGTDLFTMTSAGVITLNNDLDVSEGGTGASTFTDGGLLVGAAANPIEALAVGGTGTILTGVAGANPTWTTATYPATAAVGTILIASGANTITTLAPDTAGYVLTDGGAGVAPSWQANPQGTVTSVSGGTNISTSGTAADPVIDLDAAISGMTSITMADTGSIQTTTVDTDTMLIQGYDVDGTAYVPFITITNANDPTCDLNTGVTIGTKYIYRADGTDIPVADGGTGASTLTDHGVLVGSGTGAITALAVGTDGQVLVGSSAADPVFATITDGPGIGTTLGAGALTISNETTINNQTGTTYTLVLTDQFKYITFSNAAAITCTIPTNAAVALPIGTQIGFQQLGAGQVTFSGAGTTLQSADTALTTVKQYSVGYMIKTATDTWSFGGDLEA